MDREAILDILNELLGLEQESSPDRLTESTMFISRLAVEEAATVQEMVQASREHSAWLSDLIVKLEGIPGPRVVFTASADLHFQELSHVLPRLMREHQALIRKYEFAAGRVTAEPLASELVERILRRHRQSLEVLRSLNGQAAPAR